MKNTLILALVGALAQLLAQLLSPIIPSRQAVAKYGLLIALMPAQLFILGGLTRNLKTVRSTLGTVRKGSTGAAPATTEFKVTMAIGATGVTFRAASYVTGDYNIATYYTVQAQEEATFGQGQEGFPDNQGFVYLQYQTTAPAAIDGPIRLQLEDAHNALIPGGIVLQEESTRLDASQTDRRLMVPLPKHTQWATEDSFLMSRINPTATATSTQADSTVQIPITLRRSTGR